MTVNNESGEMWEEAIQNCGTIPAFACRNWGKPKNLKKTCQTAYLPNVSQTCYHYAIQLSNKKVVVGYNDANIYASSVPDNIF